MLKLLGRWLLLIAVTGLVLALDQSTKTWVLNNLELGESWEIIPAIAGIFKVTRSYNTGAAFGMFPFASDVFLVVAFVTTVVFIISFAKLPAGAIGSRIAIGLIMGGALGNGIDRLRFDQVTDFFHITISPSISNISNFADHAIILGVIILLIDQYRLERAEMAARAAEEEAAQLSAVEEEVNVFTPLDEAESI